MVGQRKFISLLVCLAIFLIVNLVILLSAETIDSNLITALVGFEIPFATALGGVYLVFVGGNVAKHMSNSKDN